VAEREDLERELSALHGAAFGWAISCCARDRDEAADVLQDVYFKLLSGRVRWDGRSSLKTFVFGVVRLTAMERRRWRFFRGRVVSVAEHDDVPAPSAPAIDRETAEALARALARLSERQREVLHLVFYEGLTIAEASDVMKVSLGTARTHYERGKAEVLAMLQKEGVSLS
jgi:RNA polymerase sigma-70 factor (ECF subfamily)